MGMVLGCLWNDRVIKIALYLNVENMENMYSCVREYGRSPC
jgi:hypothetical protein